VIVLFGAALLAASATFAGSAVEPILADLRPELPAAATS